MITDLSSAGRASDCRGYIDIRMSLVRFRQVGFYEIIKFNIYVFYKDMK